MGDVKSRRTHCRNKHEYTRDNTIWIVSPTGRYRRCRTCYNAIQARWKAGRKANP